MNTKKILALALAAVLLVAVTVAGTIAYLTAESQEVLNEFTPSSIKVELDETTGDKYQLIPGMTIPKNPKVTVTTPDVNAYVFVTLEKSENLDTFVSWVIADGWTPVEENVWVREVVKGATGDDATFDVLKDNQVVVKDVTDEQMTAAEGFTNPTMTFKAYIIQKDYLPDGTDAAGAWALLKTQDKIQ